MLIQAVEISKYLTKRFGLNFFKRSKFILKLSQNRLQLAFYAIEASEQ
jgi:hypothetical protein